jgi:prevent-host-death family protein
MDVPVSEAKGQLTDLVRRAEAGEDVILTRFGQPAVKLVPIKPKITAEARRSLMEDIRKSGPGKALVGPSAARSQDFLYDEVGMPK